MKTKIFRVIFMITYLLSFAFAEAQTNPAPAGNGSTASVVEPSVLPDYLPIGSEQAMLEWVTTNSQLYKYPYSTDIFVMIYYTGLGGEDQYIYTGLDGNSASFEDFKNRVELQFVRLMKEILGSKPSQFDSTKPVRLVVTGTAGMTFGSQVVPVISLRKEISGTDALSMVHFRDFETVYVQPVMRVEGLEEITIKVDSDPAYTYYWNGVSKPTLGSFPKEMNWDNFLVFKEWYSTNLYHARFIVKAKGKVATYTQLGSKIVPPSVKMISDQRIEVVMTPGSDTVVETSVDMVNWSTMSTIPWDQADGVKVILTYPPSEHRFFRAYSE